MEREPLMLWHPFTMIRCGDILNGPRLRGGLFCLGAGGGGGGGQERRADSYRAAPLLARGYFYRSLPD